jgi:hypothetical protein
MAYFADWDSNLFTDASPDLSTKRNYMNPHIIAYCNKGNSKGKAIPVTGHGGPYGC